MAVKKINIITSLCGAGLEREAILLRSLLSTHGIESNFIHYCGGPNERMERADLNICLEVICPQAFSLAPQTWLAPNCEWWPSINEQYLPRISKILSKTQDCQRIWSAKVGADKCVYTSFEARDLYRPEIPRHDVFLHVAGKSACKGTDSVIAAWQLDCTLPPLIVVAENREFAEQVKKNSTNITLIPRAKEEDLVHLMNTCRFHVLPSQYEGFGHVIHESLGCGAHVLTTDAPPMNEYEGVFMTLRVASQKKQRLAQMSTIDPETIKSAVRACQIGDYPKISLLARDAFLINNQFFRDTMMGLVKSI